MSMSDGIASNSDLVWQLGARCWCDLLRTSQPERRQKGEKISFENRT